MAPGLVVLGLALRLTVGVVTECTQGHPPPDVMLRQFIRQHHPEVLAADRRDSTQVVALILDEGCHLQLHKVLEPRPRSISRVDSTLAAVFPDAHLPSRMSGGITRLGDGEGKLIVLWAVRPTPTR
jgi:hypothetical protein